MIEKNGICPIRKWILYLLPAFLGLAFLIYVNFFERGRVLLWLCPFYESLGVACPGCGATRCVTAIFRLELAAAYRYHTVVFVVFFIMLFSYIYAGYVLLRHNRFIQIDNAVPGLILAVILLYTLIRNLPGLPELVETLQPAP
ncbi:MAG: DUF2752 domain-containing protein [Clostridiales bacterium]|jgi:hypothetical protein|nr:DUF2752 domain-containing protein [Clostridiales bacterium]